MMPDAEIPLFMQGATYPIDLIGDAVFLLEESRKYPALDERNIPPPKCRALARGSIITAFNFVECLFIELVQKKIQAGEVSDDAKAEIKSDLESGSANITRILRTWLIYVGLPSIHGNADFGQFDALRELRNNLIHAALEPHKKTALKPDDLLKLMSSEKAAWAVEEAARMGSCLYKHFKKPIPPELAKLVVSKSKNRRKDKKK